MHGGRGRGTPWGGGGSASTSRTLTRSSRLMNQHELHDTFGTQLSEYDVTPETCRRDASASDQGIARPKRPEHDGRYQFATYWALGLVDARPGNTPAHGNAYRLRASTATSTSSTTGVRQGLKTAAGAHGEGSGHVTADTSSRAGLKGDIRSCGAFRRWWLLVTLEFRRTGPGWCSEAIRGRFLTVPEQLARTGSSRACRSATIEELLSGNGPDVPRLGLADAPTFLQRARGVSEALGGEPLPADSGVGGDPADPAGSPPSWPSPGLKGEGIKQPHTAPPLHGYARVSSRGEGTVRHPKIPRLRKGVASTGEPGLDRSVVRGMTELPALSPPSAEREH